jgi:hypothetical protein
MDKSKQAPQTAARAHSAAQVLDGLKSLGDNPLALGQDSRKTSEAVAQANILIAATSQPQGKKE